MAQLPWALSLISDRLPESALPYVAVTLDPDSQTAIYTDQAGRLVPMAKHGTNKSSTTASQSGGSDGTNPQPQRTDDSTVDYSSD
jgi:putative ATP-grasp target RiPP